MSSSAFSTFGFQQASNTRCGTTLTKSTSSLKTSHKHHW